MKSVKGAVIIGRRVEVTKAPDHTNLLIRQAGRNGNFEFASDQFDSLRSIVSVARR